MGAYLFLLTMEEKKKVIVYVDGFNFYYGLRNPSWKMVSSCLSLISGKNTRTESQTTNKHS